MLSAPPKEAPNARLQLHASTVVINGKAIAFSGPSGVGKSGAALAMMARGAHLLADDITWLQATPDALFAQCPPTLSGQIEARGIGILNAPSAPPAPLRLIVDLGITEPDRLPQPRSVTLLGHPTPLLHRADTSHFIDAVWHYIHFGMAERIEG